MPQRQSSAPLEAQKYQYWTNEAKVETLDAFIAGATEHKGSWWPDWIKWSARRGKMVPAKGARVPGKGKLKALEDAPGSYVRGALRSPWPRQSQGQSTGRRGSEHR